MSQKARARAKARKPAKRIDPLVPLEGVTITTTQWLKLMAYAEATRVSEGALVRVAIAHFIGGISEWQR